MNFTGSGTSGTSGTGGTSGTSGLKRAYPYGTSSSPTKRSARFDELLGKFGQDPQTLSDRELNELACKCMSHGDVEALRGPLERLETLEVAGHADDRAWETLLSALSESCSIKKLILREHPFHSITGALLLKVAGQIPKLDTLRFHSCGWNLGPGELTCPPLRNLQELHVEAMDNPLPLMDEILKASQVSRFHFASNTMPNKNHAFLAGMLSARCHAKLRHLTLRNLRTRERSPDEGLLKHYVAFLAEKTTVPTHLDLSENRLNEDICSRLAAAWEVKPPLVSLNLAACGIDADGKNVVPLVKLDPRSLDLSNNAFTYLAAAAVFESLGRHGRLRHLDLRETTMHRMGSAMLADRLKSLKLVSLHLRSLPESEYKPLINAVPDSLRVLLVEGPEQFNRTWMTEEGFLDAYPNYVALMARVDFNWLKWKEAVLPSATKGMSVVLGGLGIDPERDSPHHVPDEIATNAGHLAAELTRDDVRVLTLLNKHSARKD